MMTTKSITLSPYIFEQLKSFDKIHHMLRGKEMSSIKVGDSIKFKCGKETRKRKVISSEKVQIVNRIDQFPLVIVDKTILNKFKSQTFARREGLTGVSQLNLMLKLKDNQIAHGKIIHFTTEKYS